MTGSTQACKVAIQTPVLRSDQCSRLSHQESLNARESQDIDVSHEVPTFRPSKVSNPQPIANAHDPWGDTQIVLLITPISPISQCAPISFSHSYQSPILAGSPSRHSHFPNPTRLPLSRSNSSLAYESNGMAPTVGETHYDAAFGFAKLWRTGFASFSAFRVIDLLHVAQMSRTVPFFVSVTSLSQLSQKDLTRSLIVEATHRLIPNHLYPT